MKISAHSAASPSSATDSSASPAASTASPRSFRLGAAIVLALSAVLFFARLGARALWSSEFRWAEIAREMLLTHNYFWPTINGHVYYDKPLGSYWLVLAATHLTGSLDETAARLPCAIAGLLAVWFVMLLGRRLYGDRTAIFAGAILATSFSFVFFSRHASADVETVTGELAALILFLRNEDNPTGWWLFGLWLIMAATSLTKGLLGFVLPLMVIGLYSGLAGGLPELWRSLSHGSLIARLRWLFERYRWLLNWKSPLAIALGLFCYYEPFAISAARVGSEKGLEMVYRENVVRYFHPFDHRGPVYLYVYVIFALMAPWSAFLPASIANVYPDSSRPDSRPRADRFTLIYFWATFIFFTLSGSRRSYYLLPILPAAALMVASTLSRPRDQLSPFARALVNAGFAVLVVAVIGGAIVMLPPSLVLRGRLATLPPAPDRLIYAVAWIFSLAAIIWACRNLTSRNIAIATAIGAALMLSYLFIFAMPAGDQWRGERPFALAIRRQMDGATSGIALYKTVGPLYYLNLPKSLPFFDDKTALMQAASDGQIRWVIVRERDLPNLAALPVTEVTREETFPFEPRDHRLNKEVLLKFNSNIR